MRWSVLLLFFLVSCVPVFAPDPSPASGAELTRQDGIGQATFTLNLEPEARLVALRFPGKGLSTDRSECLTTAEALECTLRDVGFFELTISGIIIPPSDNLYGVICRTDCHPLYLPRSLPPVGAG